MTKQSKSFQGGRGTGSNPTNRFEKHSYSTESHYGIDATEPVSNATKYLEVFPKTIVNSVKSPDVGMDYSLNPYQGCEHGCTYCYARPTHEYWGYSSGVDFEQVILVKKNAPDLLKMHFEQKRWQVKPIVISGNTDCYQPCEKEFRITRQLLEVFLAYRHPVGIITKNVLMDRDLDIIAKLAEQRLVSVNLSITTLDEGLRRKLEPRTATAQRKLDLVERLVNLNVPVNIMACPIIPAINDHEILEIAKATSERGATSFHSHIVRLMGPNEGLFEDWLTHHFPDRKSKVLNLLKSVHNGKTGSSAFGTRMRGEGTYALHLMRQGQLAKQRYFSGRSRLPLRTDLFRRPPKHGQLALFD